MASLTVAGNRVPLAIREFFVTPRFSTASCGHWLVLAAVWHIEFLRAPAADDDIHRYVWTAVAEARYNPYLVVPTILLEGLHTPETRVKQPGSCRVHIHQERSFFFAQSPDSGITFALK